MRYDDGGSGESDDSDWYDGDGDGVGGGVFLEYFYLLAVA